MSMIGGGKVGHSGTSKTVRLNDVDGTDNFTIKDADGVPIFKVDSKGVVKTRRGIQRL